MARRTRKAVGPGRVERIVKQGPCASVVRTGKGQAGSAANRKGKAAKDEVPWDKGAIGIDILKAEREEAAKTRKNRQKPVAEAASQQAVFTDIVDTLERLENAAYQEVGRAEDLLAAFRQRWGLETLFWDQLKFVISKVEAKDA